MAVFDYLLPISEPDDYIGVFNPVEYTFSFNTISQATFDSTTDGGLATVKVSNLMAALFNVGDNVIIGGGVISQYAGVKKVLAKNAISGGLTRVTFDTGYAGVSPEGILIPFEKVTFDIWVGFEGTGSSRLAWSRRDQIIVSPNVTALNYQFDIKVFLKKWYDILAPMIGNDYNISIKYTVIGQDLIPEYSVAKNAYYGYEDISLADIEDRLPVGNYPIAYVERGGGDALPVVHSVIDGLGVVNFPDDGEIGFETNWLFTDYPPERTEPFFASGGYYEAGIQNTQGTLVIRRSVLLPNVDSITIGVAALIRLLPGNSQTLLQVRIDYIDSSFQYFPMKTFTGNEEGVYEVTLYSSMLLQPISNITYIGYGFIILTDTDIRVCGLRYPTLSSPSTDGGSGEYVIRNILTDTLNKETYNAEYYFDGLAGLTYTVTVLLPYAATAIDTVTPALPSWITAVLVDEFHMLITIDGTDVEDGDYEAIDYASVDYNTLLVNARVGCYNHLFTFISGTFEDFRLSFCISPISQIVEVCPDDVINLAFLNQSGGFNSVALECTYINGREFGGESLFKTSDKKLKRSRFDDVYDTITLSASVVSRRSLELIRELRSSISVFMWNEQTLAFDIPVVIDRSNIQTVGNRFNQAQSRVSMTIRKSQEVLTQTQ